MNFILLDENFSQIYILDDYESLIWTDRYYEAGDFEIYTSVNDSILDILRSYKILYLWSSISDHLMMVEEYSIQSEYDSGSKIVISGSSIEKILDQRIIWNKIIYDGDLQNGIKKLVDDNAISPSNYDRIIPNLYFDNSDDTLINGLTCSYELSSVSLYESVKQLCINNKIGFRIKLMDDNRLSMKLYSGKDRSYSQFENPYVVFSPEFENLGSSNYLNNIRDYKNVVAIPFKENSSATPSTHSEYNPNNLKGLYRREMVAESISSDGSYTNDLGKKDLNSHPHKIAIEGSISPNNMYIYGKDFFIGDIVQIRNEYGFKSKSRVTEIVMNQTQDEFSIYPTFTTISEEEN